MALRYGSPKDSELLARRVTTITFGLYTSPAYRDKLKAGDTPAFVGFDEGSDFVAEAAWLARRLARGGFHFAPTARRRRLPRHTRATASSSSRDT